MWYHQHWSQLLLVKAQTWARYWIWVSCWHLFPASIAKTLTQSRIPLLTHHRHLPLHRGCPIPCVEVDTAWYKHLNENKIHHRTGVLNFFVGFLILFFIAFSILGLSLLRAFAFSSSLASSFAASALALGLWTTSSLLALRIRLLGVFIRVLGVFHGFGDLRLKMPAFCLAHQLEEQFARILLVPLLVLRWIAWDRLTLQAYFVNWHWPKKPVGRKFD